MAVKTARLKATPTKENGVRVEEGLSLYKSDKFDADAYVQSKCSINEKDIKQLCSYLLDLKKISCHRLDLKGSIRAALALELIDKRARQPDFNENSNLT